MSRVVFYTKAYNAENTLERTIRSVLAQTEQNWIWYLLDNGSTDRTGETIRRLAQRDPRIVPLVNKKNNVDMPGVTWRDLIDRCGDSDRFCWLDADDTYSPDFLEQMLAFIAENRLDIAACGSNMIWVQTGASAEPQFLPQDLVISRPEEFDRYFPYYYQFIRPTWGKLFSVAVLRRCDMSRIVSLPYGWDTLYSMEMLRNAGRFGVLARSLHQYYISPKSLSYQWVPRRVDADRTLYQMACSYLIDKCGAVSAENRFFLQRVYSKAVNDTSNVIQNSTLSPADKLREYRRVATHPITQAVYRECDHEDAVRSRAMLLQRALRAGVDLQKGSDEDLRAAAQSLCPKCGRAVSAASAPLFLETPRLFQLLAQDEPDALLRDLLARLEQDRGVKKYDLPKSIQALASDHPLLFWIDDAVFLRKYGQIYRKVWEKDELSALDEMTGLLLEGQVSGGRETFLRLYISLAASLEQAPAFVFGKTQLARLYLRQDRREDCRALLDELAEMGVESDDLTALRQELEAGG